MERRKVPFIVPNRQFYKLQYTQSVHQTQHCPLNLILTGRFSEFILPLSHLLTGTCRHTHMHPFQQQLRVMYRNLIFFLSPTLDVTQTHDNNSQHQLPPLLSLSHVKDVTTNSENTPCTTGRK